MQIIWKLLVIVILETLLKKLKVEILNLKVRFDNYYGISRGGSYCEIKTHYRSTNYFITFFGQFLIRKIFSRSGAPYLLNCSETSFSLRFKTWFFTVINIFLKLMFNFLINLIRSLKAAYPTYIRDFFFSCRIFHFNFSKESYPYFSLLRII